MPKTLPKCPHGLYVTKCKECNRKYNLIVSLKSRQKWRNYAKEHFGNKCIICNTDKWIEYHEIHGIDHHNRNPCYYVHHLQDFVPICHLHHRALHVLKPISPENLEKFLELLKELKSCPINV